MVGVDKLLSAAIMALGIVAANTAAAHTKIDSLGAPIKAVDMYQVTCSDDGNGEPKRLLAQIKDFAPVADPVLSVLTFKGNAAISASDLIDGDDKFSRLISNTGGVSGANGVFYVFVSKTAPGIEKYQLEVHCMGGTGDGPELHTGTDITPLQNR